MRTHTLRNLIGILIAAAVFTALATLMLTRMARSTGGSSVVTLASATQILKVAQTEKFQTDMKFAESNDEAKAMLGNQIKLGRIDGADRVQELNVRAGGVIEYLLDKKGDDDKPQRVIYLPYVGDPMGSQPIEWRCLSGNWSGVGMTWGNCTYDKGAWDRERQHVASLRASADKLEGDAESRRAKYESDRVRTDFEREREYRLREADRQREYEERDAARLAREAERAHIESERQKRGD